MSKKSSPVKVRFGHLEFIKLNADHYDVRDVYHWTLTLSWPVFGVYLVVNLLFSVVYWLGQPCIEGATSYSDAFFFSVETFATVGYGHFFPNTLYGHIVSTLEIMVGLFGMAVI